MCSCLKELAKKAVSSIQPTQCIISSPFSTYRNYIVNPQANHQIFGFRGYVCDKCLTAETKSVAFPNAEGEGRIQERHLCHPLKAAAASKSIDRSGELRSLHDKIPILLLEKIYSWTGNNNHLVSFRLSSPPEEIITLRNPADPSKPGIVFPYSEQRHLSLERAKENKDKYDYLTRAITLGTTPLSNEELIDFLEHIRNATFGVVTVHNNNTHVDNLSQDSLSYFVYIN
jgi:hypothetical protein